MRNDDQYAPFFVPFFVEVCNSRRSLILRVIDYRSTRVEAEGVLDYRVSCTCRQYDAAVPPLNGQDLWKRA